MFRITNLYFLYSDGFETDLRDWDLTGMIGGSVSTSPVDADSRPYEAEGAHGLSLYGNRENEYDRMELSFQVDLGDYASDLLQFYWTSEDLEWGEGCWLDVFDGNSWHMNVRSVPVADTNDHSTSSGDYTLVDVSFGDLGITADATVTVRFRAVMNDGYIDDLIIIDGIGVD